MRKEHSEIIPLDGTVPFDDLRHFLISYYWGQIPKRASKDAKRNWSARKARTTLAKLEQSLRGEDWANWHYCINPKTPPFRDGQLDPGPRLLQKGVRLIGSVRDIDQLELVTGIHPKLTNKELEVIQEALLQTLVGYLVRFFLEGQEEEIFCLPSTLKARL